MGFRKLLPLVVVVAIVGIVLVIQALVGNRTAAPSKVTLTEMVPDNLAVADVRRVEIVPLGQADKLVVLKRDGDGWTVESLYGAPADADKVETFIKDLKSVRGELRAADVAEDKLADWDLGAEKGLAVKLYGKEGDRPTAGLVLGKSAGRQHFARELDGSTVYVLQTDVKGKLGIHSRPPMPGMAPMEDENQLPESKQWMRREVVKLDDPEAVREIKLSWPDKQVVLRKVERPVKKADDAEADDKPAEPRTEWVWTVVSGGPAEGEFQPSAVSRMLESLGRGVTSTEAVDPEKKDDWGLVDGAYRAALTDADGKTLAIVGGRPDPAGQGYLKLADGSVVFRTSGYDFEQVFPRGVDLFRLNVNVPKKDDITAVTATSGGDSFTYKKGEDAWSLTSPKTGLDARTAAAATLAEKIAALNLTDYADGKPADYGLEAPWASVTFTAKDAKPVTVKLGNAAKAVAGRYVAIEGKPGVYTVSTADADAMKLERFHAFSDAPISVDTAAVVSYEVSGAKQDFTLKKTDKGWSLTSEGKTVEADPAVVGNLIARINQLRADELLDKQTLDKPATVTLKTTTNGKTEKLTVDVDKQIVRVDGVTWDMKMSKEQILALFPTVDSLKAKPADE